MLFDQNVPKKSNSEMNFTILLDLKIGVSLTAKALTVKKNKNLFSQK